MPRLLDHLTDLFKKTDDLYHAMRYNAGLQPGPQDAARTGLDGPRRATALSDYLARRTLDWLNGDEERQR